MSGHTALPPIDNLKSQAKRLRDKLRMTDGPVSHAGALEMIAHQYGYRDWNTLHAAAGNQPSKPPVVMGQHVRGSYLGQRFEGEIIGISARMGSRYRITIAFDQPVDVVRFESFSALRRRVSCTIDSAGRTPEKTSNGTPHLQLDLDG